MKRFTETTMWEDDWYISLKLKHMLLWHFIKDKCDHAGIWKPNVKLFEGIIGDKIDLDEALNEFNNGKERIRVTKENHWFLVDFFKFQYGHHINENNKVHASAMKIWAKEGIIISSVNGLLHISEVDSKLTSSWGQVGVNVAPKDKDKDKDKEIDKEEDKIKRKQFEAFIEAFPIKTHKMEAWGAFCKALAVIDYEALMGRVRLFLGGEWKGKEAKYIPNPATWLEKRRWEDEPKLKQTKSMYELKSKE